MKNHPVLNFFRFIRRSSILALPGWQRVLLVLPACLLLWLGVAWALEST